jgi:Rrf2 family protein
VRGLGTNARTRYGVQTVIYLAQHDRAAVVPVSAIAAAVSISPKALEDILAALRVAGIVQSRRGKEGGYQLVPAAGELTLLRVVEAMEGPVSPGPEAVGGIARATADAFDRVTEAATRVMAFLTVEELVKDANSLESEQAASYMYFL